MYLLNIIVISLSYDNYPLNTGTLYWNRAEIPTSVIAHISCAWIYVGWFGKFRFLLEPNVTVNYYMYLKGSAITLYIRRTVSQKCTVERIIEQPS